MHLNFLRLVSERLRSVNAHFINEVMRTERLSLVGAMANSIIHDLKNPICIIRCCTDLIAGESNDPRLLELTSMADKAVDGMLAMTQELLDYARGSTSLACETVSIWRLLDELNQQALRLLPGQNIQFARNIRYDGNVVVDLTRFIRVLCNLIKNAREAMPSGGILTIGTDLIDKQVVIRISDTGIGIPAELLPKLFEPFVTHGKSHGTGLGMAIAKVCRDGTQRKNLRCERAGQRDDRRDPSSGASCSVVSLAGLDSAGGFGIANCELQFATYELVAFGCRFNLKSASRNPTLEYPVV